MAKKPEKRIEASAAPTIGLSITFNGPMLYDFVPGNADDGVDIYVPYCPYHEAGFFFSHGSWSETDLWNCALQSKKPLKTGDRIYAIEGIPSNANMPTALISSFPPGLRLTTITPPESNRGSKTKSRDGADPVYILKLDGNRKRGTRKGLPPTITKAMFKLSVPMPLFIGSLYHDSLEVVADFGTKPTGSNLLHCTALRFFYEWDAASKISLNIPDGTSRDITPPVYEELPTMADIEVRYEGFNIADENDPHSDARSCFASLSALAGPEWWLSYGDGMSSPTNPSLPTSVVPVPRDPCQTDRLQRRVFFHTGADCHAPVVVNGLELS
jgi:hypothetical protein